MNDLRTVAAAILGMDAGRAAELMELRHGARSRALFAVPPESRHRWFHACPQVVAKLYKGDWTTIGGQESGSIVRNTSNGYRYSGRRSQSRRA